MEADAARCGQLVVVPLSVWDRSPPYRRARGLGYLEVMNPNRARIAVHGQDPSPGSASTPADLRRRRLLGSARDFAKPVAAAEWYALRAWATLAIGLGGFLYRREERLP